MSLLAALSLTVLLLPGQESSAIVMAAEPAFQKKVSPNLRLVSVRNVLDQLTKDLSTSVSVQTTVAELKVALFVNERSLGWVLDNVADVLDLEWRKEDGRYRLIQSPAAAAAYSQTKKRFEDHRRATSRAWIAQLAESSRYTRKELADQLKQVQQEAAATEYEKKPGWSDKLQKSIAQMHRLQLATQSVNYALGLVAQQHRLAVEQSILTGQTLIASTEPIPGALALPPEMITRVASPSNGEDPKMVALAVSFGPLGLEYGLQTLYSGQAPARRSYFDVPPEMGIFAPKPADRFGKWGSTKSEVHERLTGKILSASKSANPSAPEMEIDQVLDAAERSGLDFVGDAFHSMMLPRLPPVKTAADYWSLKVGNPNGPWLKVEDGAVLYRHAAPWMLREIEIPEPALKKLNDQLNVPSPQILESCAQFAAPLSRLQRRWIGLYPPFRPGEQLNALMTLGDLLAFWGSLPAAAKASALRHEVVPFSKLGTSGGSAYRFMLQDMLIRERPQSAQVPSDFLYKVIAGDFASMALLVEPTKKYYSVSQQEGMSVLTPIEEAGPDAKIDRSWSDVHFYFGLDATRAIRITAPIPFPAPKG